MAKYPDCNIERGSMLYRHIPLDGCSQCNLSAYRSDLLGIRWLRLGRNLAHMRSWVIKFKCLESPQHSEHRSIYPIINAIYTNCIFFSGSAHDSAILLRVFEYSVANMHFLQRIVKNEAMKKSVRFQKSWGNTANSCQWPPRDLRFVYEIWDHWYNHKLTVEGWRVFALACSGTWISRTPISRTVSRWDCFYMGTQAKDCRQVNSPSS